MTAEDAVVLARELYNLQEIENVKEFVAYDDRNFYLRTARAPPSTALSLASLPASPRSCSGTENGGRCARM